MRPRLMAAAPPSLRELARGQRGLCFYCGQPMRGRGGATVDHKTPIWAGGRDEAGNRVAACGRCNHAKGPLDAETFQKVRHDGAALAATRLCVEQVARRAAQRLQPGRPR